jgi:hypothetical protein
VFAPDPGHIPALAYVATDDKGLIGFVAGYIHRAGTFYVSKMGVMPERRRQCNFYKPVWEKIRRDGFFTILGMIENTNRPVLLRMLRDGWMICGFRVIEDGKQLVEVIKWLKSDNNNQL